MNAPNHVALPAAFHRPPMASCFARGCRLPPPFADHLVSHLDQPPDDHFHLRVWRWGTRHVILEWPAYAISHGFNPLYSRAMFYPTGVNLLSNAGTVAIGVLLAPITWLFGPVATLNVAVTLSPVLSSLAMFILLRRWVSWAPAAFFGGLFYGFSPFFITNLTNAHFFLGMAVVPPLVVACLDELLVRQRSRPVVTGIVLGLLITLQFF